MMKKWKFIVCSMLAVILLAACGNKVDEETEGKFIEKAEEVVHFINDGKFDKIIEQLNDNMKANLTAEQLAEMITPVLEESGSFKGIKKQSVQEKDGIIVVVLVGEYSEEDRIYTVSYDADDRIAGLFVQ